MQQAGCRKVLPIHYNTYNLTPLDKVEDNPKNVFINELIEKDWFYKVECSEIGTDKAIFPDAGVECKLP